MDFDNPTPAMIEEAAKSGIDLRNPYIRAELMRLKKEKEGKSRSEEFISKDPVLDMTEKEIRAYLDGVVSYKIYVKSQESITLSFPLSGSESFSYR